MSWLSQLFHKTITPAQFADKAVPYLRNVIGKTVTPEARTMAKDTAENLKAYLQGAVDTYLQAKLGTTVGGLAAHAADQAIATIAATLEGIVVSHDPAQHPET